MKIKHFRLFIISLTSLMVLAACQTPLGNASNSTTGSSKKNTGPVTLNGHCEQRETDGYGDKIDLVIDDNVVKTLDWTAMPRGGSCRFELKNFNQVSSKPNADLQSKTDKKCHIYVWQDDNHVTVASYACKKSCRLNDKVLPVLLDPKTGNCKPKEAEVAQANAPKNP